MLMLKQQIEPAAGGLVLCVYLHDDDEEKKNLPFQLPSCIGGSPRPSGHAPAVRRYHMEPQRVPFRSTRSPSLYCVEFLLLLLLMTLLLDH